MTDCTADANDEAEVEGHAYKRASPQDQPGDEPETEGHMFKVKV